MIHPDYVKPLIRVSPETMVSSCHRQDLGLKSKPQREKTTKEF